MRLDTIYNEDCLVGMQRIPDGSVDCIICDLPYGTTGCKWDNIIPFDKLWEQYKRIIKKNSVIALFGSEPFSSHLRMSNIEWYKYDWVWIKTRKTGFVHAKNMPLKQHELISVFSPAPMGHASRLGDNRMVYNPQGLIAETRTRTNLLSRFGGTVGKRPSQKDTITSEYKNYPTSILNFKNATGNYHPTEKPVDLIQYLVRTYTSPGDTILDNCMGSGTTAIACIRERRHYIGFELNKGYYEKAQERIHQEESNLLLFS